MSRAVIPSPFHPVLARITWRATVGRRRTLLLLLLPVVLLILSFIYRDAGGDDPVSLLSFFGIRTLLPLMALLVGTEVLGRDLDEGTAVHLLATPMSRTTIVLTKLAVAIAVTAAFAVFPILLAGYILVGWSDQITVGYAVAALAGSVVYCSLFLALSVLTRRAIVAGLGFVLVWELLLGNLIGGVKILSVQQYVRSFADAIATTRNTAPLSMTTAVALSLAGTAAALVVAVRRLRDYSLTGEDG
jgi:ABC-2 type transport system permease protein